MRHNDQQKGAEREGPSSNSEGLIPGSTQVEAESSLGKVLQKVFLLNSRIDHSFRVYASKYLTVDDDDDDNAIQDEAGIYFNFCKTYLSNCIFELIVFL